MKKFMLFFTLSAICMSTTSVFASDTIPPEAQNTYRRSGGSNKLLKEYNLHSEHNSDVKREYNTSNKNIKYIEVTEKTDTNTSITSKKSNSVKSFNFKNTHESLSADSSKKKTSPFRANKWKN